ncbi:membrane protein insertion efficiency factor YidD [Corynebacterium sp.]|uniref:membrane protein insertion efficiency factor YidD n=1 Tax=Corynebacterium sp. TaxID=1720 RepID=UPI0026050577|nr:membrane protein insertion efficiency factor YidD [Corynebacterium sp.]
MARRAVLAYQDVLSPLKMGPSCRFEPTCSNYALMALERHGLLKGLLLSIGRLLRCAPWHPGGWDPVPPRKSRAKPKPEETPQDFETSEK